jgi:hypothetical protein
MWKKKKEKRKTDQSSPSLRPSPFTAEVLKICHVLFFSAESPRPSETSDGVIAFGMSYFREPERKRKRRKKEEEKRKKEQRAWACTKKKKGID